MNKVMIKHVWFDMSGTLTKQSPEFTKVRDNLRYRRYAEALGKRVNTNLIKEYEELFKQHHSNSAVFRSLGMPADYWANQLDQVAKELFISDVDIYQTLDKLRKLVPISLFTNIKPEGILAAINVDKNWFTHIISAGMLKQPKPSLEGFYKVIELSDLPADEILFVGDSMEKEIIPAKSVGLKTCLMWSKSDEADYSFNKFSDLLTISDKIE